MNDSKQTLCCPNTADRARRFDLIVFDWDGTLFDSTRIITRSIQQAVCDVGGACPSDAAASYVIGLSLGAALAQAAPDVPHHKYPELTQRYRHHYLQHHNTIELFEGVRELLDALRMRQHLLAVATGKTRRGLDEALRMARLEHVFHDSRTVDETSGKPDPLMLRELMAVLDVSPDRTLMIGDTSHDLLMAEKAGCASVGVSYGAHEMAHFNRLAPLFVATSVAELHAWLSQHG